MKQCEFCDIPLSGRTVLPEYMQDIPVESLCQNILYNGDYFYVKPDISPVVEDHLLIIPKEHIFCINNIPSDYIEELNDIKQRIIHYYHSKKMNYIFFEHGCCTEKEPGSSCIHHAHLHAIPITVEDEMRILKQIISIVDLPNTTLQDVSKITYLFWESEATGKPFYWIDDVQRSQFFRIIIADIAGFPNRARWQNCLVDEMERKRSEKWLQKYKDFSLG